MLAAGFIWIFYHILCYDLLPISHRGKTKSNEVSNVGGVQLSIVYFAKFCDRFSHVLHHLPATQPSFCTFSFMK